MDLQFISQGVFIILIISGIPLLLSGFFSLILAFIQTITQIQEQSLSYVIKCIVVFIVFYFGFNYFGDLLIQYFNNAFLEIIKLGNLSL